MSLLDTMPHRCTIRHQTVTKGSLGGSRTTPVVDRTGVHCWEQNASHGEILEYEKRGMVVTHKVYFAADPGVTVRHQILVTERGGAAVADPIVLDVRSEARPDAGAGSGVVFKVMAEQKPARRN